MDAPRVGDPPQEAWKFLFYFLAWYSLWLYSLAPLNIFYYCGPLWLWTFEQGTLLNLQGPQIGPPMDPAMGQWDLIKTLNIKKNEWNNGRSVKSRLVSKLKMGWGWVSWVWWASGCWVVYEWMFGQYQSAEGWVGWCSDNSRYQTQNNSLMTRYGCV